MPIDVNPHILVWARKTSGLSLGEAAPKLGLMTSARTTATDQLGEMESGQKKPTRKQLRKMAKVYRRPLLAFYMAEPPKAAPLGIDFRQSSETRSAHENALLDALLRDVSARQGAVRDILADDDNFGQVDFVNSVTVSDGVENAVAKISSVLDFDNRDQVLRTGKPRDLFENLRTSAEAVGVFVLVVGDLGSRHSRIQADDFRGYAIADHAAPFIIINAHRDKPAHAFTLVRELARVLLGKTGVSGCISTDSPSTYTATVEQFCNDVAAEFLLPNDLFHTDVADFSPGCVNETRRAVESIARRWAVSESIVVYRLNRMGNLTARVHDELWAECQTRRKTRIGQEQDKPAEQSDPFEMKRFQAGNALMKLVHEKVRTKELSYTKAAIILDTKPGAVEPLLRHFNRGSVSSFTKAASGRSS